MTEQVNGKKGAVLRGCAFFVAYSPLALSYSLLPITAKKWPAPLARSLEV